ncbi:hypothetical protein HK104_008740, partial [Borealophlyctis nickersoniae]
MTRSKRRLVRALHDFVGANDTYLTIREGDIILVMRENESGWWFGMSEGAQGQGGKGTAVSG